MFLQPRAGHDAQWAGRLPSQWVGLREELGFQATPKEPANEQTAGMVLGAEPAWP